MIYKEKKAMKAWYPLLWLFFIFFYTTTAFGAWEPVEWKTPVTKFRDLGVNPTETAQLAGDGMLVIILNPKPIELWTPKHGRPTLYEDARIVYAITQVNAPVEKVRQVVKHFSGKKPFTAIKNVKILTKQGCHTTISFHQASIIPVLRSKSEFILQMTEFKNGDIGALLHKGDVGALVMHFEFFKLNNNQTLLVMAFWQDLNTAKLSFRLVLKATPSLKQVVSPMMTDFFIGQVKTAAEEHPNDYEPSFDQTKLPDTVTLPYLTKQESLPLEMLLTLSKLATVQIHPPAQRLIYQRKDVTLSHTTTVRLIRAPISTVRPILTDFSTLKEYHPFFRSYESTHQTQKDYSVLKFHFKLGPLPLIAQAPIYESWINENIKIFHGNDEADLKPVAAGMEFIDIPQDNSTLFAFTFGGIICDEAPFYLKLLRYIPSADKILSGGFSLLTVDNAADWLHTKFGKVDPYKDRIHSE